MLNIKKYLAIIPISLLVFLSTPTPALAQSWLEVNPKCVSGPESDVATIGGLECLFGKILRVTLQAIGIAVFVMILVAGFNYLTAGEDPKKAEAAKNTLTMAIGGIVAIFIAWFILLLITQITDNQQLLEFNLIEAIN